MIRFWTSLGVSAVATFVLAWLARRFGWGDAATGAEAARKPQRSAVPTVGGLAVLIAVFCAGPRAREGNAVSWLVLGLAFLVGAVDDWRSLKPGGKLALQTLALVPAAASVWEWSAEPWAPLLVLALGLAAMNLANTFDNADGALTAVAIVGLLFVQPVAAAALIGFLPFNLDAGLGGRREPTAYLGDSGSYVVGLLVVFGEGSDFVHAWPALWIPLLDLLRLSVVRWRVGSRPWIGDRRHLAHRLQAAGWSPLAVAGSLGAMALPGCLGFQLRGLFPGVEVLGLALGALIFGLAVRRTPASQ